MQGQARAQIQWPIAHTLVGGGRKISQRRLPYWWEGVGLRGEVANGQGVPVKWAGKLNKKNKISCYLVYPASKSSMTIRHCCWHTDLVSYSIYISLNISVSFRNLVIFSTSQWFPSSALKSPWILNFFLLSLHWGQSCIQCFIISLWFLHATFLQVGGSFLDIKCPWVSLECPICILLSLTSYCL